MFSSFRTVMATVPKGQDFLITIVLVAAIAMMVLPIPTVLVDIFISFNFGLAVLLVMTAVFLGDPLEFSTLPAVILISTLFRLALSIATTRLILSEGDAGTIVRTFGEFVVAGSVTVGLVVFLIITVVHFIVIAKGSERVAEVAARFTLDALPGKQMSVDAELRNGTIQAEEAKYRREVLETESQLYGAMDGAMKFVKGDAMAGLVIVAVNLIGGLIMGIVLRDLSFADALREYSLLTVGDALISQIPALLLAVTAATIVTRVSGTRNENLGVEVAAQLTANHRALMFAAVLLILLGLLPGFPTLVLTMIGTAFGVASFIRFKVGGDTETSERPEFSSSEHAFEEKSQDLDTEPRVTVEMQRELSTAEQQDLQDQLERVRFEVAEYLGIKLPKTGAVHNQALEDGVFRVSIEGVPVMDGEAYPGKLLYQDDPENLDMLDLLPTAESENLEARIWVDTKHKQELNRAGLSYLEEFNILANALETVLSTRAAEFMGIQETRQILVDQESDYSELVREVSRLLPLQKIAFVFRGLLNEGVPVRNIRQILEVLAVWSEKESDPTLLTEYVRTALKRQICHACSDPRRMISGLITEREIEEAVRQASKETAVGGFMLLEPKIAEMVIAQVRLCINRIKYSDVNPVIMTALDVRRHLRNLLTRNGLDVPVLSYQDLADDFTIQTIGSIGAGEVKAAEAGEDQEGSARMETLAGVNQSGNPRIENQKLALS